MAVSFLTGASCSYSSSVHGLAGAKVGAEQDEAAGCLQSDWTKGDGAAVADDTSGFGLKENMFNFVRVPDSTVLFQ